MRTTYVIEVFADLLRPLLFCRQRKFAASALWAERAKSRNWSLSELGHPLPAFGRLRERVQALKTINYALRCERRASSASRQTH